MKTKTVVMSVFVGALSVLTAQAANTYYVDNTLDDYTGADGSEKKPFKVIQQAVEKAASGDTVLVKPGIYGDDQGTVIDTDKNNPSSAWYSYMPNRIWINNKHITLKSTGGAAVTHIVGRHSTEAGGMGDGAIRCIAMSGSGSLPGTRIEGFTIRDGATKKLNQGKTTSGGDCDTAHMGGGFVFRYTQGGSGAKIHVVDCVISNCVAAQGAAAFGVSFVRSRIEKNYSGREYGATIAQCNAVNCIFADNGVVAGETTVRVVESTQPVRLVNCTFWNNMGMLAAASSAVPEPTIVNSIIQRNKKNSNGTSIMSDGTKMWYCFADVAGVVDLNKQGGKAINVAATTRVSSAILAAPLFGDFHPVTATAATQIFGIANKAKYDECVSWVPEADRGLDMDGNARWDEDGKMTPGAYQQGVAVGGGCLTITAGDCAYTVDGKSYRPNDAYFYAKAWPEQHRVTFTPASKEVGQILLNGYIENGYRFPGVDGSVVVTMPPVSTDKMLSVEPVYAGKVFWVDASNTKDGRDGSEGNPMQQIQTAVDQVKDGTVTVIKVKKGVYNAGGKSDWWGYSRVYVPTNRNILVRSVDGPEQTFICGESATSGADKTGCGTAARRCVAVQIDTTNPKQVGFVGFTLTGGRTRTNAQGNLANYCYGGGIFANSQDCAQFVDCIITNCAGVRGSAAYKGWLQNCRIFDCHQSVAQSPNNGINCRGVFYQSYLSSCVVGPNDFKTVVFDEYSKIWNVTFGETWTDQPFSGNIHAYNALGLSVWSQPKPNPGYEFVGCAFHVTNPKTQPAFTDYLPLDADPLVDSAAEDFRPKAGTAVLGAATSKATAEFVRHTVGGFYGEVFPSGAFPIGASSEAATAVALTKARGVTVEGSGLSDGYASEHFPLTLTATLTDRGFYGFKANGELMTDGRTLTLAPDGDVSSYMVEPLYEKLGTAILVR